MDQLNAWIQAQMIDIYHAMGGKEYDGATSAHLATVEASHYWNMEYGRCGLEGQEWNDYYVYSETEANKLISAGQNESPQGVTRYWELMQSYLAPIAPECAGAAGAGVVAAEAIATGTLPKGKNSSFPWWLIAVPVALYLWRK